MDMNKDIKMTIMKKSFAFTLTESLIMVAIVGVIATITMVSLSGLKPNKDKMLLQKAYRSTLSVVSVLANDPVAYPQLSSASLEHVFNLSKHVQFAINYDLQTKWTDDGLNNEPGVPISNLSFMCYDESLCEQENTFPLHTGLTIFTDFTGLSTSTSTVDEMPFTLHTGFITLPIKTSSTESGTSSSALPDEGISISTATGSGSPTGGGNSGVDDESSGSGNSFFLPNIGSAAANIVNGELTITPASAVLTNRDVPSRDTGKYTSTNKFAYLFADKMVAQTSTSSINKPSCSGNACSFVTPDGMTWTVTDNFKNGDTTSTATIEVDINGSKGPNKAYDSSNPTSVKTPDRFTFFVLASGQVVVQSNDAVAVKYLKSRESK